MTRQDPRKLKHQHNQLKREERKLNKKKGIRSASLASSETETNQADPCTWQSPDGDLTLRFEPVDTWFFRESRPFNAVGASEVSSVFPPPIRTLVGALRTRIGNRHGCDWSAFATDTDHPVRALIGGPEDLGPLLFEGPWLERGNEVLYPVPHFLIGKGKALTRQFGRLGVDAATLTDLGNVRLPRMPTNLGAGYTALGETWLTANGMSCVLTGGVPGPTAFHEAADLYATEPRLGIARDNRTRTAADQMLYQTRHIRPARDMAVCVNAKGIKFGEIPVTPEVMRLGGEGRCAWLSAEKHKDILSLICPRPDRRTRGLILTLLTAADLDGEWLPPGFSVEPGKVLSWRGEIGSENHKVSLCIHAAVIGRVIREGGWNSAAGKNGQPREVRSLIPPGSAWYCTIEGNDFERAITTLHGARIGRETEFGRGWLAVGLWQQTEFPKELKR